MRALTGSRLRRALKRKGIFKQICALLAALVISTRTRRVSQSACAIV
jgi:hypothetical protein